MKTALALAAALWPLRAPFTVMNTIATLQYYGDRPGFHHGVDLRTAAGAEVYAPVSGRVGAGYYYPRYKIPYAFMVSIDGDDGYRWELHHVDPATVPPEIMALAEKHGRVEAGTLLARVYDTSKAPELKVPSHLHVDLLDSKGVRHDALGRFPALPIARAPKIRGVYLVRGDRAVPLARVPPGAYEVVVDALETISPGEDGDVPYSLEVRADGKTLGAFRFDELPDADYLKGVEEVYRLAPFKDERGETIENSVENGSARRFLLRFPLATADFPGLPVVPLTVVARDRAGDETRVELRLGLAR